MSSYAIIAEKNGLIPLPLNGKCPFMNGWPKLTMEKGIKACSSKDYESIGVLCGAPSGIVVVDIDKRNNGVEKWKEMLTVSPPLPSTFTVATGGGGYHYYFKYDARTALIPHRLGVGCYGIDFCTDGCQVVFAGSVHPYSGKVYGVLDGYDDSDHSITITSAPDWLVDFLKTT